MRHAGVLRLVGWNQRVLEVGCTGGLARALAERGCQVVCMAADAQAAQDASGWCERVLVGDLDELDVTAEVGDSRFDVVVVGDILGYLAVPHVTLGALARLLAPGGYVVASVPNVAHAQLRLALLAGSFPSASLGLDDAPRRFFTRASLLRLLAAAELIPLHVEAVEIGPTNGEAQSPARTEPELAEFVTTQPDAEAHRFVAIASPAPLRGAIPELIASLSRERDELARQVSEQRSAEQADGPGSDRLLRLPQLSTERIDRSIAPEDGMLLGGEEHYFSCGASAWRCIAQALLAAGAPSPRRILDFACGHGRVMRALRAGFPDAKICACDVDRPGVDFCAETFGAVPVYATETPAGIELPGTFDLIWCGSLLTHMSQHRWPGYLELLSGALSPGGVLVFSTHGRRQAESMDDNLQRDPSLAGILSDYRTTGFGYTGPPAYGASLSSPSWVLYQLGAFPELRLLSYEESGWDDHQDVVACVRRPV